MTQPDDVQQALASESTLAPEADSPSTTRPAALILPQAPATPTTPELSGQPGTEHQAETEDRPLEVNYVFSSVPDVSGTDPASADPATEKASGSADPVEHAVGDPPLGSELEVLSDDLELAPSPTTDHLTGEAELATPAQPAAAPVSAVPDSPAFATGDLEEETYAPTVAPQGPQVGNVISGYRLEQDLGRGWFRASAPEAGPGVTVYVRPQPLWAALRPHRLLPKLIPAGDVLVMSPTEGKSLTLPLDPLTARSHLTELARLLFALEKQGYAVTDLDPASIELTPEGLKLRVPPQVAQLGQAVQPTLRDSFTPPEVQEGQFAQAKSGVYLLGALFFQWLTSQPLPAEGPSPVVLAGVSSSGVPQLLSGMLAPLPQRLTPTELLTALEMAVATLPVYQLAASTDIGLNPERPTNEDSYGFVWRQVGQHGGGQLILRAVVSDGMGGMAAGEVASQAAVQAFLNSAAPTLEAQVWEANAAVLSDMQGRDGGCTITAVEIRGTQLQLGHVGDTRAYLVQGGAVQQLSKDHSYVAALVANGQMTPEEAQVSPERNKVLRSLGSLRVEQDNYVQILPEPLELLVGSRVLLVSDGVWGEVLPPVLHDIALHEPSLQRVVDHLIELSLESGAPDNATALVIERIS